MTARQKAEKRYQEAHQRMERALDAFLSNKSLYAAYRLSQDLCRDARSQLMEAELKELRYYPR
jgi:hypothetical protein